MLQLRQEPQTSARNSLNSCRDELVNHDSPHLPSPQEIEEVCREIRRGWSEAEHRRRAGMARQPLEIAAFACRVCVPGVN